MRQSPKSNSRMAWTNALILAWSFGPGYSSAPEEISAALARPAFKASLTLLRGQATGENQRHIGAVKALDFQSRVLTQEVY